MHLFFFLLYFIHPNSDADLQTGQIISIAVDSILNAVPPMLGSMAVAYVNAFHHVFILLSIFQSSQAHTHTHTHNAAAFVSSAAITGSSLNH